MNKDTMAGQWKQMKGAVKKQWGKLTDDDLTAIEGGREVLLGKIQERYGIAKDEAERQVLTRFVLGIAVFWVVAAAGYWGGFFRFLE